MTTEPPRELARGDGAAPELERLARTKIASVLGPARADQIVDEICRVHGLRLEQPEDLARFGAELKKRGGIEGAIGAMLGVQAAIHAVKSGMRKARA